MTKVFAVENVLSADEDKVKYVKGFKHWLLTAIYKTSCPLAIHVKWPGFPRRSSAPRLPSHSLVPYWLLSLCRVRVPWNTTVKHTMCDCEAQTSLRPCLPAPHPHPATPHARAPWKKEEKNEEKNEAELFEINWWLNCSCPYSPWNTTVKWCGYSGVRSWLVCLSCSYTPSNTTVKCGYSGSSEVYVDQLSLLLSPHRMKRVPTLENPRQLEFISAPARKTTWSYRSKTSPLKQ